MQKIWCKRCKIFSDSQCKIFGVKKCLKKTRTNLRLGDIPRRPSDVPWNTNFMTAISDAPRELLLKEYENYNTKIMVSITYTV